MAKQKKKDSRKSVNFDLHTESVRKAIESGEADFKSVSTAWGRIKRYLKKNGFEHIQGSGYISKEAMDVRSVRTAFLTLGENNPWLAPCMKICTLTSFDYGDLKFIDLKDELASGAELAKQSAGGLTPSPSMYSATKDPRDKAKADKLRETLKVADVPAVSLASAPDTYTPTAKAPSPMPSPTAGKKKPQGGGNDGAGR